MSFVGDDHRYTRGVGAIASMDAASPKRRIAAARAARDMERRDVIMALGATRTRTVSKTSVAPPGAKRTTTNTIETGQEAAFSRPAPVPGRPMKIKLADRGLFLLGQRTPIRPTVKLPGSVIEPPKTSTEPAKQSSGTTLPPTKAQINIIAGGSGTSWTSGKTTGAPAGADNPPPAWAPEPEAAPAATAAPAKKPSSNMLLYAGLGIGALWLLTRK